MLLKESALLFSLYKGQPVLCKDVYCCTVYKSLWIIHRIGDRQTDRQTERKRCTHRQRECVFVYMSCVINCQEESLAAWGSRPNSMVLADPVWHHCLWLWLPSVNPLVLKFSYHWYCLLVKIHPLHMACSVLFWKHGWFSPRTYSALNIMDVFIILKFYFSQN